MRRLFLLFMATMATTIAFAASSPTDTVSTDRVAEVIAVSRPISSTYQLETGGGSAVDTYVSPLRYHGFHLALSGDWTKALPQGKDLSMTFQGRVEGMRLRNPAGNATEWQGAVGFNWLMRRGWCLTPRFVVAAGGGAGLYAGALYIPRNGNNPVAAKGQLTLQGAASASYTFNVGSHRITLHDEVVLPVVGAFFSQNYGQPYYNIYLGNSKGLVHCGWWGNNFCIDNLLSGRITFSRGTLGLGYRYRLYSQHISHLDTRIQTHAVVISWSPSRLCCRPANILEPLY